jgi:cardiolipin synthase
MISRIGGLIRRKRFLAILFLVLHIGGFISSIDAVMRARTSQGAIAWVISLNTIPIVSLPAYWVLGRTKFQGYVLTRQQDDSELSHVVSKKMNDKKEFISDLSSNYPAVRAAELLADLPLSTGNSTELLIDGEATFKSIFEGVEQANEYVLVQFYIVKDDDLGRELKDRLILKAREGIDVYFLYDEIGSYKLPESYLEELRLSGVQAVNFHSQKGPRNRFQINFRNHRKIVVVDGISSWVGGHNVGDEYLSKGDKFDYWRDTHMKIEGPATLAVQLSFIEDWHWATEEILDLDWQRAFDHYDDKHILIIPSGPADKFETAGLMFTHAINSAKKRIWIASPYFVPDESIVSALQLAGLRGVDVRILIPDEPDHLLVYLAAFAYFQEAEDTGVQFYRYTNGFMHQKAMLIDDSVSGIGTANFDNRSFRLNFEITAMVVDREFNKEVEQMFLDDFHNSSIMESGAYSTKPFWFKLAVRLANLTSPML